MSRYAEKTTVPSEKSRMEIERDLRRHGATAFSYGWDEQQAVIMFELADRRILFRLPMPDRNERRFTHTPAKNQRRSEDAIEAAYEQGIRQRWRALALVIKAKLEGGPGRHRHPGDRVPRPHRPARRQHGRRPHDPAHRYRLRVGPDAGDHAGR